MLATKGLGIVLCSRVVAAASAPGITRAVRLGAGASRHGRPANHEGITRQPTGVSVT